MDDRRSKRFVAYCGCHYYSSNRLFVLSRASETILQVKSRSRATDTRMSRILFHVGGVGAHFGLRRRRSCFPTTPASCTSVSC